MADSATLEERVTAVERAVSDLQQRMRDPSASKGWLGRLYGAFNDRPEFAEVVRLGREFRESQPVE